MATNRTAPAAARLMMMLAAAFLLLLATTSTTLAAQVGVGNYSACGVTSPLAFTTWNQLVATAAPLIFPQTEAQLIALVKDIRRNHPGCHIRVVGTGSSTDGLVALRQDNVVVVNLAEMQVPAEWNFVLKAKKRRVRVGAGKSLEELLAYIRPRGFIPETRSYAKIFTVGGWFLSPTTHGATFNADRATKSITGLRVLTANGKVKDITKPNEVAEWRGSLGLLGIVLALELEVIEDKGIAQTYMNRTFTEEEWNLATVMDHVRETMQGVDAVHWNYNFWTNTLLSLRVSHSGNTGFNKEATAAYYATQLQKNPTLSKFGTYYVPVDILKSQLAALPPMQAAYGLAAQAENTMKQAWTAASVLANDGYTHTPDTIVQVHMLGLQIKCPADCINDGHLFTVMSIIRDIARASIGFPLSGEKLWLPNFHLSLRIFTASNKRPMKLELLKPGKYIALDFSDAKGVFSDIGYSLAFKRIENALAQLQPSPHVSKSYGFEKLGCLEGFSPFQNDEYVHGTFTDKVKKKFIALMEKYDKKGIFRAGAALHLLGLSENNFETRALLGETCAADSDCADACCCIFPPTCAAAGVLNKCVPCNSPVY